jgi:hypothetical protein
LTVALALTINAGNRPVVTLQNNIHIAHVSIPKMVWRQPQGDPILDGAHFDLMMDVP